MTSDPASISPALKARVSTGYARLDEALRGGFLTGSTIVLSAPASDEIPLVLRNFLMPDKGEGLLLSRSLSAAQAVSYLDTDNLKCLICSEKTAPPSKNMIPGKSIDNLTELNLQITEAINSVQPKRVAVDVLSDVLLRHKGLQTRKWLTELLERLRSKGITTLATLNPYMHSTEEVQAVVDLFDGNLEMIEKDVDATLRKYLLVRWMHGVEVTEKEVPLLGLTSELEAPMPGKTSPTPPPLREPRWLTPLVSRSEELSRLKAAFDRALTSAASVLALQGEAGVGKTRLMQELTVYAQSKNAVVLSGSPSEDGIPYAPWIEVTRQYVAQAPGELLRRMIGTNSSELVKLVPDITAKLGTIPPSKPLGEQQDKLRFYEAVTQFFVAICKDSPLLLLFDDMQYVDHPSLDLLEYLVRSTSSMRILTLCSYPTEITVPDSLLRQTLMKFNKQRLLETVSVKNLNKDETIELIRRTFGEQTVTPEFSDLIFTHTGGNPFFVEEVLRSLVEDGTIFRTEKGWDRKPIQDIVLPESVKSALKRRLMKLEPETLTTLTTAAVIGSGFDFDVLREVTQATEDLLLERLETVINAGLISEVAAQEDAFRFADSRIREVLLTDLIRSRRTRLHGRIGEAMEKVYSQRLANHAELIANHFSEAGQRDRTIKYLVMAADNNATVHAHEKAIHNYKRALELLNTESGRDQEKAEIVEKLARCYRLTGLLKESIERYRQALNLFERLGEKKACARISTGLADASLLTAGYRESIRILHEALRYLESEQESFEAASVYARLAHYHSLIDEWEEGNKWAEKAFETGMRTGNFKASATGLSTRGSFLTDTGRIDEGLPLWQQALDMATEHEDYEDVQHYQLNLAAYTYPRDLAKAREIMRQRAELCRRWNLVLSESASLYWLFRYDRLKGDWPSAALELEAALATVDRLGLADTDSVLPAEVWKASFAFTRGEDVEKWNERLQTIQMRAENFQKITDVVEANLALGLLRLEQGREPEAQARFERCVEAFKKWEFSTEPLLNVEALSCLTVIYANRGELDKGQGTLEWAKRIAETLKSDAGLAMVSQAEGNLLLHKGNKKASDEAYSKCLALWEKAGWPYYRAKALTAYSEAVARTNPAESKKRLGEAADIFRKLGAKRDLQNAESRL